MHTVQPSRTLAPRAPAQRSASTLGTRSSRPVRASAGASGHRFALLAPTAPSRPAPIQRSFRGKLKSFGRGIADTFGRWTPSVVSTEPNLLQAPSQTLPPGVAQHHPTFSNIGTGLGTVGSGMQFAGSVFSYGSALHRLNQEPRGQVGSSTRDVDERERREALGTGVGAGMGMVSSGAGIGSGILSLLGKGSSLLGKAFGTVGSVATAPFGLFLGGLHGRRTATSANRYRKVRNLLKKDDKDIQHNERVEDEIPDESTELFARPTLPAKTRKALEYARTKNRNQAIRGGLGATAGLLTAGAGAAGLAALLGASMATPIGWGLAGGAAAIGLGLGAWKLGQWARRKYQAGKKAGVNPLGAIFTRQSKLQQKLDEANVPLRENPLEQKRYHAGKLLKAINQDHAGRGAQIRGALGLDKKKDILSNIWDDNRSDLIAHRLRSSG